MQIDLTRKELETVLWALRDGTVYNEILINNAEYDSEEHQKVAVQRLCKRAISDNKALQDKLGKYMKNTTMKGTEKIQIGK